MTASRQNLRRLTASLLVLILSPAATIASLRFGFDPVAHEAAIPLIHRNDGYVGSSECASCHEEHTSSWARTFHRTMTQRASQDSVLGRFDGEIVTYFGKSARPFRKDGKFFMEVPAGGSLSRVAEVALTVGSRRYQQYFEREERARGFAYVRLPILWHVAARRWLHLNTVFLHPDDADWDQHRSDWNENCIFCHNTGPEPHLLNHGDIRRTVGHFDSNVAELGISCEACHGPGAAHASSARAPLARYETHFSDTRSAGIVNPSRLDKERAVAVCGQCHGQRLPEPISRIEAWLTTGPTFRSGDRLAEHVKPIAIDTPAVRSKDPDLFRVRFWADGTPRLTAYELQGTTASPCYQRGEMTCGSCHAMHAGDPRGQLRPDRPGNELCLQCHGEIARDVGGHTGHSPASSGSSCVECHMPKMVYGVAEIHRSHRIENPDPKRDGEAGRPHACTLCHLDKSLLWSASEMSRLWKRKLEPPARRRDGAPLELADSIASVHAGDAVQRAVYARAMGRADSPLPPRETAFLRPHLAIAMGDGYPSIRFLAQRSLRTLESLAALGLEPALGSIDHCAGEEDRRRSVFGLLRLIAEKARAGLPPPPPGMLLSPDYSPDLPAIVNLTNLQGNRVISIGE